MQKLTNDIRVTNPNNIIVTESIDDFQYFQGLMNPRNPNARNFLFSGGNIIYAIHPYFYIPSTGVTINNVVYNALQSESWFQTNAWAATWGQYANSIPVLVGEWSQQDGNNGECEKNGAVLTKGGMDILDGKVYPTGFLQYVSSLHIGIIGWSLTAGAMLNQSGNLTSPNNFTDPTTYLCQSSQSNGTTAPNSYQGSGSDLLKFFTNGGIYN